MGEARGCHVPSLLSFMHLNKYFKWALVIIDTISVDKDNLNSYQRRRTWEITHSKLKRRAR
jgi:hypothetical protein